jgi:hypothetical protein
LRETAGVAVSALMPGDGLELFTSWALVVAESNSRRAAVEVFVTKDLLFVIRGLCRDCRPAVERGAIPKETGNLAGKYAKYVLRMRRQRHSRKFTVL